MASLTQEQYNAECTKRQQEIDAISSKIKAKNDNITALNSELQSSESKITTLANQISEIAFESDSLYAQIQYAEQEGNITKYNELKRKKDEIEQRKNQLNKQLSNEETKKTNLINQIQNESKEVTVLTEKETLAKSTFNTWKQQNKPTEPPKTKEPINTEPPKTTEPLAPTHAYTANKESASATTFTVIEDDKGNIVVETQVSPYKNETNDSIICIKNEKGVEIQFSSEAELTKYLEEQEYQAVIEHEENKLLEKEDSQLTKEEKTLKQEIQAKRVADKMQSESNEIFANVSESQDLTKGAISNMFKVPVWSYDNYVKEINDFRKGINLTGEPGWFYFKIFFHFDESYGLLGDILTDNYSAFKTNTAASYLYRRTPKGNGGVKNMYGYDRLDQRLIALIKFVKYLSFINQEAPWFFDKIDGLNNIQPTLNDFSKEKSINISCWEDAVDMRLASLFHLYQYACFDEINQKEIIPENLRKFNMSVFVFHVPIRNYNYGMKTSIGNIAPKQIYGDYQHRMSFKMFTFRGCEFDLSTLNSIFPGTLDNAQAFNLGKSQIKINYDRVYTHMMNEWEQFMLGPDGFYHDVGSIEHNMNDFENRLSIIMQNYEKPNASIIQELESDMARSFLKTSSKSLGNIYNLNVKDYYANVIKWANQPNIYLGNLFDIKNYDFKVNVMKNRARKGKYLGNIYHDSKDLAQTHLHDSVHELINSHWDSRIPFSTEYVSSPYELVRIGTYYQLATDWHASIKNIAQSWVTAGNAIAGIWTSAVNTAKFTANSLENTFKFW